MLAVLLHPVGIQVGQWITQLYPIQQEVVSNLKAFEQLLETAPYAWLPYVLMALLPAICEELAFRGFVLSGLRHLGSKWWAIGLSAVFFGMAHGVIQQSISAAALGIVIGYIAVQTGSLVPCILFHLTYNAMMFGAMNLPGLAEERPGLRMLFDTSQPGQFVYNWPVVAICFAAALVPLFWLYQLPYQASKEESISDARARQPHHPLAASAPGGAE
jgi:sodium transport system permease protein